MITRRHVLAGTAVVAAPAVVTRSARAARTFHLRFGDGYPATHPLNIRVREAIARIKDESHGRVVIQLYSDSTLGGDSDLLTQVRSGAVDFFSTGGLILSTLVPIASINGMGFVFNGYDQVWPAMDGAVGALIRDGFAKAKLHAFDRVWDNGFRQITSSTHPINDPADLHGFKIRVPISPVYTSLFQALAAAPTSINLSEVYSALQTRIADGQENPPVVIETSKFYEVQKYLSLTNHIWDGSWILANGRVWASLPPDLQTIVERNFDQSALDERADVAKLNASLVDTLAHQGLAVNRPDPAPFRAVLQKSGFYAEWRKRYGDAAWTVLEQYVGKLA